MFRILLTAYFSLVMACGPALCCCSFQRLANNTARADCCAHKVHNHDVRHGHRGTSHKLSKTAQAVSQGVSESTQQVCDEHQCECNRDAEQLASLPNRQLDDYRGIWDAQFSCVPTIAIAAFHRSMNTAQRLSSGASHASLYGREMLRAYQVFLI